jgi:alpha-tubulin suppressor-like RCC1 family protein
VQGLDTGVQAVVAGESHTCALVNDTVRCWGWNQYGQLGSESPANSLVPAPAVQLQ